MKILIICTGNTCRSQMAHGFLKTFDPKLEVYSAGTYPEGKVNPRAVKVMGELGIDISGHVPTDVRTYVDQEFDYVITVCDGAKEICPVFTGAVKHRMHIGFEDPASFKGSDEEALPIYRKVRDQIREAFEKFIKDSVKS